MKPSLLRSTIAATVCLSVFFGSPATARAWQTAAVLGPASSPDHIAQGSLTVSTPTQGAGQTAVLNQPAITLEQALALARANEPAFAAALATTKVAQLDRAIARSA